MLAAWALRDSGPNGFNLIHFCFQNRRFAEVIHSTLDFHTNIIYNCLATHQGGFQGQVSAEVFWLSP